VLIDLRHSSTRSLLTIGLPSGQESLPFGFPFLPRLNSLFVRRASLSSLLLQTTFAADHARKRPGRRGRELIPYGLGCRMR
jgi:hypothetical protein